MTVCKIYWVSNNSCVAKCLIAMARRGRSELAWHRDAHGWIQ